MVITARIQERLASVRRKRKLPDKVAIFGSGPAGLFAAHAIHSNGLQPVVFSKRDWEPSELFGAQYLHAPIPGLIDPAVKFAVDYRLNGTAEAYAAKVYGVTPVDFVSPDKYVGVRFAWDIRVAYGAAWREYRTRIIKQDITPDWISDQLMGGDFPREFRFIINTIPLPAICIDPTHRFTARDIWASGDAPARQRYAAFSSERNTVTCDGTKDRSWYRAANILGHNTVEWSLPEDSKPPYSNVARVTKPVSTNCNCWESFMLRVGRYGAWTKGVLSHEAYFKTVRHLERQR